VLGRPSGSNTWESGQGSSSGLSTTSNVLTPTSNPGGLNTSIRQSGGSSAVALIGRDCRISGRVELGGVAQIDGSVSGEIVSTGELVIGEGATVEAKITGVKVRVFGSVSGDLVCSERLELHTGAKVLGNISSPSLIIQDGVVFEGQCFMQKSSAKV